MATSFLTNVADFDSLLGSIRTFLNTAGWTIHRDLLSPDNGAAAGGRILVASKDGALVGLRSTTSGAGANRLYLFDGIPPYTGTPNLDSLPGNSGITVSNGEYTTSGIGSGRCFETQFAGPFPTVKLFTNLSGTYCHIIIEVVAGRYRHIQFGNMQKFGTWTGGAYYSSQRWSQATVIADPASAQHTVPFDGENIGLVNWTVNYQGGGFTWISPGQSVVNSVSRRQGRGSVRGGFGNMYRSVQESAFSSLIALNPVTIWAITTTDTPQTARCIGRIPDVAEINMRNLQPGESYFIGADEWIVFPLAQKGLPSARLGVENSGYYGLAYLVRP